MLRFVHFEQFEFEKDWNALEDVPKKFPNESFLNIPDHHTYISILTAFLCYHYNYLYSLLVS